MRSYINTRLLLLVVAVAGASSVFSTRLAEPDPSPPIGAVPILLFGHTTSSQAATSTTDLTICGGDATGLPCPPNQAIADRCQVNTKVVCEGNSTPTGTPWDSLPRNEDYNLVRFRDSDVYRNMCMAPAEECGTIGGSEATSAIEFDIHFRIVNYYHNTPGAAVLPTNPRHAIYAIDDSLQDGDYVIRDGGVVIVPNANGEFTVRAPINSIGGFGTGRTLGGHFIYAEFIRNDDLEAEYEEVWVEITGATPDGGTFDPSVVGWNKFCRWIVVDNP